MASDDSVAVILTRMEGKIDRMGDRMEHYERDMTGIRGRLHDLGNMITPVVMLDLPARIRVADDTRAQHDARLQALENIEERRKGAAVLARVLWGIFGAVGVSGVAAIVTLLKMGGI